MRRTGGHGTDGGMQDGQGRGCGTGGGTQHRYLERRRKHVRGGAQLWGRPAMGAPSQGAAGSTAVVGGTPPREVGPSGRLLGALKRPYRAGLAHDRCSLIKGSLGFQ